MQPVSLDAQRYDSVTIFFHWAIAALVVFQWVGAQTIDWFPRGALRVDARSVHIVVGALVAGVLAARLIWRMTSGRRLPPPTNVGLINLLSKAGHWTLYALLVAMVAVGMFLAWVRGDNLFNLFAIPAFDPGNRALAKQMEELHGTIGWVIVALSGLHAAAALVHRYLWRDGVLARMLPAAKG